MVEVFQGELQESKNGERIFAMFVDVFIYPPYKWDQDIQMAKEIFRIIICLSGEKSEPGKAGDSPCAGESQGPFLRNLMLYKMILNFLLLL